MPVSVANNPSTTPLLELRLLGEPFLLAKGDPLPPLRTRKGVSLLALLALRGSLPPHRVERDTLSGLLWPDCGQAQAFGSLRRALTDLRAVLGDAASLLTAPTPRSLSLDVFAPGFAGDFLRFDALPKRLSEASDNMLQSCADVYRGPLLAGFDDEWMIAERARYENLYAAVLALLVDRYEGRGDDAATLGLLRRLVSIDPLHEEPQRRLLTLLARIGDYGAAILLYRALRDRLHDEAGTEPSAQTTALFQRIRASARTGGKDFALSPSAKTPSSGGGSASTLPVPLTPLVGREVEIRHLQEWVNATGASRLMTMTGTGGVGKTRLAVEIARQAAGDGGVFWIDCAPVRSEVELHRTLLAVLKITPPPVSSPLLPVVGDYLRAQGSPVLLVWDNVEQVAPVAAHAAEFLLRTVPGLRVLATSRQPLYAQGEMVFAVSPLLSRDAEQLFIRRVCAGRPQSSPDAGVVRRLCQRLDCLPLAIELAAARAASLTLAEIETRLADRFRLLTSASKHTVPRQRTLRALVEWSYDLLPDAEQRIFRKLCVFPASFTSEFAHQVCGDPGADEWDTLDTLANLAEKSLLIRADSGRFRLLETLREYGSEKSRESGEADSVTLRHAEVFAAWAKSIRPRLYGDEQIVGLRAFDEESENLRFATDTALRFGQTELTYSLCRSRIRWWILRGRQTEGRDVIRRALELPLPGDAGEELQGWHGDLLTAAGNMARHQGDYAASKCWHEAALSHFRDCGIQDGVANSLGNLATIAHHTGDLDSALRLREEGLAIQRQTGDLRGVAMFLQNIGNQHSHCGRHELALECLTESLDLRRASGDRDDIAHSLFNLAAAIYETGDRESARTYLAESLRILREIGDKGGMVSVLDNLGTVAQESGDLPAAREYLLEGFALLGAMSQPLDTADMLRSASYYVQARGDMEGAVRLFAASMSLSRQSGLKSLPNKAAELEERVRVLQTLVSPAAYQIAWLTGEQWNIAQAIQEAKNAIEGA